MCALRALSILLLGVVGATFAAPRGAAAAATPVPSSQQAAAKAPANGEAVSYALSRSPFGLHVIDNRDLAGPVEIGARWTRQLVLWKQVEPRKGAMLAIDQFVRPLNELTEAGIEVVPRIVAVNPWAVPERINRLNAEAARKRAPMGDWTYLGMPTDLASYRRLLTTIVEAFDGDGLRDAPGLKKGIKYWQIENEWDWRWKDTPESFVAFLKVAYETVKAADPDAKVVLGGISKLAPDAFHAGLLGASFEQNGKIITPASLETLQSFREENALRTYVLEHGYPYFDIISFHQYGRYRAIEKEVEYLRGIMRRHSYDRPLWMTEVGGPFVPYNEVYTEDRHAQEVVKYYVTALASGVEVLFWSTYLPSPEWGTAFTNTSLIDELHRKKPAYYSYKLLASKLQGAVRVQRLFGSSRGQLVVFTRKTGERVYVAWREGGAGAPAPAPEKIGPLLEKVQGKILEVTGYDGKLHAVRDLRQQAGELLATGPVFIETR
jgi:hypothetical protein